MPPKKPDEEEAAAASSGPPAGQPEEVMKRREAKKKRDAMRKLEATMKKLETERQELLAELKVLDPTDATAKPAPKKGGTKAGAGGSTPSGAVAAAAPTTASSGGDGSKQPPSADDEAKKAAEAAAALLRLQNMMGEAMREHTAERWQPLEPCPSLVHPRVAEVTVMMEDLLLVGGNARTLATIDALREVVRSSALLDTTPLNRSAFEELIGANFAFMSRRREATSGMRYVRETLNRRVASIAARDPRTPRQIALAVLDQLEKEITVSIQSIVAERSLPYVSNTDTIAVFGRTSVIELLLLSRANDPQRRPREIIVLDSGPLFEGRALAFKLAEHGLNVTYGLLTSCCTLIPQCTRVFIGASAVLQNGDVFSRGGTALVATCAKYFRKPVLCFSESYKFISEVWLGNLAQNSKLIDIRTHHAADAAAVVAASPVARTPLSQSASPPQVLPPARSFPNVSVFSSGARSPVPSSAPGAFQERATALAPPAPRSSAALSGYLYDLTPAESVDMIICEMGCLHTSAIVAAIQDREERNEMQEGTVGDVSGGTL